MKNQSTEEYQEQIESVMPSERQVYDRIERHFKRQKRQLVMRAVGLLIRFVIETAVVVAIIWLVYRQCKG